MVDLSLTSEGSLKESYEDSVLLLYTSLLMDLESLDVYEEFPSVDLLLQEDKLGLLESRTEQN